MKKHFESINAMQNHFKKLNDLELRVHVLNMETELKFAKDEKRRRDREANQELYEKRKEWEMGRSGNFEKS